MVQLGNLFVLAAFCLAGASAIEWKNLYLKFDLLNGYFPIGFDLSALQYDIQGRWFLMDIDEDLKIEFYSFGEDPSVAIGYDYNGNIAGVRVAHVVSHLADKAKKNGRDFPVDYSKNKMYSNASLWGQDVVYTQVLFVSPEQLRAGGRTQTKGLLGENVYMQINGTYTAMPKKEKDAPALGFVKQGCFVGMGQHYFLGVDENAACADMPGVFLLYEGGELIGVGLIPFGSFKPIKKDWFEDPPAAVVKMIVPNRPACLEEWTTNYGSIGLHFLFKKHPRWTFCL